MKQLINIKKEGRVIYNGRMIELPLKDEFIVQRSIELFDDDDPCIIHKSYVVKGYVDQILDLFKNSDEKILLGKDYLTVFGCIDFMGTELLEFELVG